MDENNKVIKHSKYILLGVSIYLFILTIIITAYKFDNSLSQCACQPKTYESTSFILKTLLYKKNVYAINGVGCSGVNSCLPNSYIFPIDLLSLGILFFILFLIINETQKRYKRNKKHNIKSQIKKRSTKKKIKKIPKSK